MIRTLATIVTICVCSGWVHAGNYDGILLGNNAALSAGAVAATTNEASALWYNPAGLAGERMHSVDASGSAFVLRIRPINALIRTKLDTEIRDSDIENIELLSVGSSLSNAWRLADDLSFAVGVYQPEAEQFSFRSFERSTIGGATAQEYRQEFAADTVTDRFHVGLGVGWQATETFRIGIALFGIYRNVVSTSSIGAGAHAPEDPDDASGFVLSGSSLNLDHFGLQLSLGIQWAPTDDLSLALVVKSPALLFAEMGTFNSSYGFANVEVPRQSQGAFEAESVDLAATEASMALPLYACLGVAYRYGSGLVSLEADIHSPFYDAALDETRQLTWNLRFGFVHDIDAEWRIGAGLFTDHSATSSIDRVGEFDIDYYGLTFGFRTSTRLGLKLKDRPELMMTTTFALRYAIGTGQVGAFDFDPLGTSESKVTPRDALLHEVTLHIGSTLSY